MEKTIEIGGHQYALGLEWNRLPAGELLLAAKSMAKKMGFTYGVPRMVVQDDNIVFNQLGVAQSKSVRGNVYSAAGQIVAEYPTMLGIAHIENDLYWVVAAENGRIIPDMDVVVTDSEVKKLYNDFSSDNSISYMSLLMTREVSEKLEIYGNVLNRDPLDVIAEGKPNEALKLRNIRGLTSTFFLGSAIVLVLLVGAGWWKYESYLKEQEYQAQLAAEALEQQRLKAEALVKEGPSDEELLAQAKVQEIHWLQDDFNATTVEASLSGVFELARTLPQQKLGWNLTKVVFDRSAPDSVVSMWNRDGGTIQAITDYFGSSAHVGISAGLDSAIVTHKISKSGLGTDDILAYLASNTTKNQDLSDVLIAQKLPFNIEVLRPSDRREPIEKLRDKNRVNEAQLVLKQRNYTITGESKPDLAKTIGVLRSIGNLIPVTLEIDRSAGAFNWKFVGRLFEQ